MSHQHVKSLNLGGDGSKNRLRFRSSKQKSTRASADVYRNFKRRVGTVTSAASREEQVHHRAPKRRRKDSLSIPNKIVVVSRADEEQDVETSAMALDSSETTFNNELDLARDRNSSEIFEKFYQDVWHLVRSLPEILHHSKHVVNLMMAYMLSPEDSPDSKSSLAVDEDKDSKGTTRKRKPYMVNNATTDILHLLAVLARDLRHEIHPYLHTVILPRIVYDLLNPPPPSSGKQPIPLDVSVVEAAFRTMSYVFRYDAEALLLNTSGKNTATTFKEEATSSAKKPATGTLEPMRKYYGATLGHRRDLIRRLAAEAYAPLIRKLPSQLLRSKHMRRVVRALASTAAPNDEEPSRAQTDAIDGISWLFFQVAARGVSHQLHSKACHTLRCAFECLTGYTAKPPKKANSGEIVMVVRVIQAFLEKCCLYLKPGYFEPVWDELFRATVDLGLESADRKSATVAFEIYGHCCTLLDQLVVYKGGFFVKGTKTQPTPETEERCVKAVLSILEKVMSQRTFSTLPNHVQESAMTLLCSVGRCSPESGRLGNFMREKLPTILRVDCWCALKLTRDLLTYPSAHLAMESLGTPLLSAAAYFATENKTEHALRILFGISSIANKNDEDNDDLMCHGAAKLCGVRPDDLEKLLMLCRVDVETPTQETLANLAYASRCVPFLSSLLLRLEDDQKRMRSLISHLASASSRLHETTDVGKEEGGLVTMSLCIQAVGTSTELGQANFNTERSGQKKALRRVATVANSLLDAKSSSIWSLKAATSLICPLRKVGLILNDDANKMFELLSPNLMHENHFIRLHTLSILSSCPKRPFVTDHASLDITDDLDEEESFTPAGDTKSSTLSGLCDIMDDLLKIERCTIDLDNERLLTSLITRVEVMGRSGKLPVAYAEAASFHMFGVLRLKFAPIWSSAVKALVALATGHQDSMWHPLQTQLQAFVGTHCTVVVDNEECKEEMNLLQNPTHGPSDHLELCARWSSSGGRDPALFSEQLELARESGRVSKHLVTDEETVFENVFRVLELSPEVTAKKSRVVVPIFLDFMHSQYYAFHSFDPDARELKLEQYVENPIVARRGPLKKSVLVKRLSAMLKVFAAVNGPKQLFRHETLLSVFTALLTHQEASVAQLALSCIIKFKLPHVLPYADHLKRLLRQGQLREAMMNFDIAVRADVIHSDHRNGLVRILTRILFGKLSAKASGSSKAKDTPEARRNAVLSYLSVLGSTEFFPLVYLMTRAYAGQEKDRCVMEETDESAFLASVATVTPSAVGNLPDQRHEGFLNLLESVLSQLGHTIKKYIPTFMSIVLAMTEYAQVSLGNKSQSAQDNEAKGSINGCKSNVRSLCYRRLTEIFEAFADSVDFAEYRERLWKGVGISISQLPEAAINATHPPALLSMLRVMSTNTQLVSLLDAHRPAVRCVIECIAPGTQESVVNVALDFVDNLLGNDGIGGGSWDVRSGSGANLMLSEIRLLLKHFTQRLSNGGTSSFEGARPDLAQGLTCHELSILFEISRLIVEAERGLASVDGNDMSDVPVLEALCGLLVSFLGSRKQPSEKDQLNILGILTVLFPRLDSSTLNSFLPSLSRRLGPPKSRSAMAESLLVRSSVAAVMETIATTMGKNCPLSAVAEAVVGLTAMHKKRVDEIDYDTVLPVLNGLGYESSGSYSWETFLCDSEPPADASVVAPLVFACLFYLHHEDGVLARGGFKALKALIAAAASGAITAFNAHRGNAASEKFAESYLVPQIRVGLSHKNPTIKRYSVLLLAEVATQFHNRLSPNLYGDLSALRSDDPDLDFFLNITHVQLHRRRRALQRLRKHLCEGNETLSSHSLSNVLLPLAVHPVYESKTKLEEQLALEGIATVATIGRFLSWSKYHNTLWTALTQFERHPQQERYMIGMICSLLDSFHFKMLDNGEENAVWRALDGRLIPKTESLLVKETLSRGNKMKILRPMVVLALLKLFRRFPKTYCDEKIPRLIAVICDGLTSRESDARDLARSTASKMVVSSDDPSVLILLLRQMSIGLSEGYKLHVRIATLHSILLEISQQGTPQGATTCTSGPSVDESIPIMMDLILEDLFGAASEHREAEANKKFVKEAAGSKAMDSLEIVCRLLTFRPSKAAGPDKRKPSVHNVVAPLIERLRHNDSSSFAALGKVRECLNRIVVGLSHNTTVNAEEAFPFIYACIAPFVGDYRIASYTKNGDDEDSDEEGELVITVSKTGRNRPVNSIGNDQRVEDVVEWRPSVQNKPKTRRDAVAVQEMEKAERKTVHDGVSAPKLTGSGRHITSAEGSFSQTWNDPASVSAVIFGLGLFRAVVKRRRLMSSTEDSRFSSILHPFVPLLASCICDCQNNEVVLSALRCMDFLLGRTAPISESCSKKLGEKVLDILASSGSLANVRNELTQVCFKSLTRLLSSNGSNDRREEDVFAHGTSLALSASQMQVLISMLTTALEDTEHHNQTLGLIKVIVARCYQSPELYDLMEKLLRLTVRSPKETVRQQCSVVFLNYLIDFPMSKERVADHLRQVMLNLKYEYEDGRKSAIGLATAIVKKLPEPLLDDYSQLFYLPLVLQLANDEAKSCREAVADCLSNLFSRCSKNTVKTMYDYCLNWATDDSGHLNRTSLQVLGLFVGTGVVKGKVADDLVELARSSLSKESWEFPYFGLLCLETMTTTVPQNVFTNQTDLWDEVASCLIHTHPWVKRVSARILCNCLTELEPTALGNGTSKANAWVRKPGLVFSVTRNTCRLIDVKEADQNDALSTSIVKLLSWLAQAMASVPSMFLDSTQDPEADERDPIRWLLTRLCHLGRPKGEKRRSTVFKGFAAIATFCGPKVCENQGYVELMLEPVFRSRTEASAMQAGPNASTRQESEEAMLAHDVQQVLEDRCEGVYTDALAAVQRRAREKRDKRQEGEAMLDATERAARRIEKQRKKKEWRKRRVEERRQKGGRKQKRRVT